MSFIVTACSCSQIQSSYELISAHYDLGNDFFSLFLDPTMMYSSAVFVQKSFTLEQASLAKLETICQQLELSADDHLLEIGTGWGGMAVYAAENFGCKVTTTTISKQQYEFALKRVEAAGLGLASPFSPCRSAVPTPLMF